MKSRRRSCGRLLIARIILEAHRFQANVAAAGSGLKIPVSFLREFLTRFVRISTIEDVIEVKNYVAHCLAEGLSFGCLHKALPRPLAYAIYQLVYLCDELKFVVGTILSKEGTIVGTEKLKEEEREWLQRALEVTKLFRGTR